MFRTAPLALLLALGPSAARADDGLVAHWTFDEPDGEVARDVTGHGHDAALTDLDRVPSPRGRAVRFDGKDDRALYGGLESMILQGDLTLAVWVKTDSAVEPKTNRLIFGDTGLGVERNLNLRMDGYGYLRFEWADGKQNASLLAPNSLLQGAWNQVVVVADSAVGQAVMYVDAVPVARLAMPLPISPAPVKERLTGWFYNGWFAGELDDIRLYNRALSEAEVKRLFESQADVQIGSAGVVFSGSALEARGQESLHLRNWSRERRQVSIATAGAETRQVTLDPGAAALVTLGEVALLPVWRKRTDLYLCDAAPRRLAVAVRRGEAADLQTITAGAQRLLEPLRVRVRDAWQPGLKPARTRQVALDIELSFAETPRPVADIRCALQPRAAGGQGWGRSFSRPLPRTLVLEVESLPWGAYDLRVSARDYAGAAMVSTQRLVTILPDGKQAIRPLNNLVSELMDAGARGLLNSRQVEFMNPRDGWVWFRAAGPCEVTLGGQELLAAAGPAVEAMRLLPAGRHALDLSGRPTELLVRAIPALLYNVYPSAPQIAPFGTNTWERLKRHTLPNTNMIESQVIDTPEHREWLAQGKLWLANISAPGLADKEAWTPDKMLDLWRRPRGWALDGLGGIQVDEYYSAMSADNVVTTALSVARLADEPGFTGKLWIPFVVGMYGNPAAALFMKTTLGAGWPFSVEVYVGEQRTEADNLHHIRSHFRNVAEGWDAAYPGCFRRAIFTPMYSYLPYCATNQYPQADFRVHLEQQMQALATDPAFFGLWGVQPYRSNYVDQEILDCMGRLLRHYCIEGRTDRMLSDPYELRHVTDPDFEEGVARWQVTAAEDGAVSAGRFPGYGLLQGRYPGGTMGDTFLIMTRGAKAPNQVSQELKGLQPGRRYSLKVITGDLADLRSGTTRRMQQPLSFRLDGAEVEPGAFSHPFRSARGPKPFTRDQPFWMTYHWLQFRASADTARLALADWAKPDTPGGPAGQQTMLNFVEVQPMLEP